ncbi:transcription factor bHLH121-like isoform X1 [Oryza brachyantha]|uniref:transcription factor bHLH121-like isoform X1 n=1 Tax=Oryza brachyantha TaxID=4533 RepID=UPI0003EACD9D|nr:transcription factor bHLH121-like isoform X1 [Oryza brachyantha]
MDPRGHQAQGGFFPRDGACPADSTSGRTECKTQGLVGTRKVQKADREKMRRDKLNEQFQELASTLDPDRPRNDKATILGDSIQMLKDLTSQVNKLKAEYTSLSEEARELTQEKNELRDEKASLKFEVDNLNTQFHQRSRVLYPWTGMEPSVVIGPPPPYPFSVPVPIPSGAVPMHPQLQAYPYFQNQTSGTVPNPCTPYMAYTRPVHPPTDQPSNQFNAPVQHSSSNRSHSMAQDCRSKSSKLQEASCRGKSDDDFNDVATDLELKTPGSSAPLQSELASKDSSSDLKKKQCIQETNGSTVTESSSSSRCSSSGPPDVSDSAEDGSVGDDKRSTVHI